MKKKLVSTVLVLSLALSSLIACGKKDEEVTGDATDTATDDS